MRRFCVLLHSVRLSILALAGLLALQIPCATAGEAYYVLVFGAQNARNDPEFAHSWATFVKTCWTGTPDGPSEHTLESHTISWLPANMVVRVPALLPEPGHNFDLQTTVQWALSHCMRISMWGPYEIDCDLYHRALREIDRLNSGRVRYKAEDVFYVTARVTNCIHACTTIVGLPRERSFMVFWGETSSFHVLKRYRPWIVNPSLVHPEIAAALGLGDDPIVYRDWEHPRSGVVFSRLGLQRPATPVYARPAFYEAEGSVR